jgi:Flp pilus assembly protein TadG
MCYRRNDRGSRRAAAAAELALLLPVLTFLLVATIDLGRVFYAYTTITNCARNGALYACDPSTQSQSPYASVTAAAQADAGNLSPLPTVDAPTYSPTYNGTYSTTYVSSGANQSQYVKVTVHWAFTTTVTYPGIPRTTTLSRTVCMRLLPSS